MAKQKFKDCAAYYEDQDISGDVNTAIISPAVEEIEVSAWSDTGHRYIGGMQSASFSFEAYREVAAEPIATVFARTGTEGILTLVERSASQAEGDYCASVRGLQSNFGALGDIGGAEGFSVSGSADGPAFMGRLLQQEEVVTSTGTSTGIQFGTVASGQSLWAALHIVGVDTLTSFDLTIESDDNSGFTSATTRITFTQATGLTAEWSSVAGAITDDWWRVNYTLVGTSVTPIVAVGIF